MHDTRDEVARQARTEITAAEETARRMIAEARDRVAELADVRGRIAAQLRGTQAQLGTALDDLAPEALPGRPGPGGGPPRVRALAAAPRPRCRRRRGVAGAVTRPFAAVPPRPRRPPPPRRRGRLDPPTAAEPAPDVPGPRVADEPTARRPGPARRRRAHRGRHPGPHRRERGAGSRAGACGRGGRRSSAPDAAPQAAAEQRLPALTTARRHARGHQAQERRPPGRRCNRCAQHPLCQCRRSATVPCSPAGHVTRCPVPAAMSWSQPGHR